MREKRLINVCDVTLNDLCDSLIDFRNSFVHINSFGRLDTRMSHATGINASCNTHE